MPIGAVVGEVGRVWLDMPGGGEGRGGIDLRGEDEVVSGQRLVGPMCGFFDVRAMSLASGRFFGIWLWGWLFIRAPVERLRGDPKVAQGRMGDAADVLEG